MATVTSASFNVTVQESSSQVTWEWDVPTLQDETNFYTNVMGWTIPGDAANFADTADFSEWAQPSGWGFGNVHNDTENDELWIWDQQAKRYGESFVVTNGNTTADWRAALLAEYKSNLLSELDADDNTGVTAFGFDHMYGQGLAVIYNDTADPAIPPILDGLRTRITGTPEYQTLASGTPRDIATWEGRCFGRWAIVTAYAYQATGDPAWETVRDNLVFGFETSPDWEEGGVLRAGAGNYFPSRSQHRFAVSDSRWQSEGYANGELAYDAGYRMHSTFETAILAEAMWRLWVQTGSEILRERLIKIARWVRYYAHDPSWNYPNSGGRIGHKPDGSRFFVTTNGDGISATQVSKDCVYDASMVNTMVIGYKLTGEQDMLAFAQTLFSRSNRFKPAAPTFSDGTLVAQSINHVYKYIDTVPTSGVTSRFEWNKGILPYAYQLIENGGQPSTVDFGGPIQTLAKDTPSNTWAQLPSSNFTTYSKNFLGSPTKSILEQAVHFFWNSAAKELHIRGGGSSAGGSNQQRHLRWSESAGEWDAVTPWLTGQNWVHQWGHFTGDPKTGDLYFRRLSSNKIYRWEYKPYPWSTLDTSGNDSWPEYATGGWPDGIPNALSIAWHPDLNGGDGGMVHFNTKGNDADIWASNDAALTSWSQLASDIFPAIDPLVEGLCTYLPGQKWVMFGGGTQDPWRTISYALGKVEADGTVTKLNDVPFVIGANSGGKIVGHPNGRVFGVDFQNQNLYEYSEGGDSWSTAGLAALPFTSYWSTPVMIPEFNCIYVAAQETSGGDSAVQEWIYKL